MNHEEITLVSIYNNYLFIISIYLIFFFVENYEIWSEELIRQICNTYFGTRRNVLKISPEKSKVKKINNRRGNRTLKVCSIN